MPLRKEKSKRAVQLNIAQLIREGYKPRQAVAIAYSTARGPKRKKRK